MYTVLVGLLLYLLDLLESKYVLSELVSLYFHWECGLEIGVAYQQSEALLQLLLPQAFALLSE